MAVNVSAMYRYGGGRQGCDLGNGVGVWPKGSFLSALLDSVVCQIA